METLNMSRLMVIFAWFLMPILAACSSSDPVPVGLDTYMVSDTGAWSWDSAGNMKAALFRKANAFCLAQGKELQPISTTANNADFETFAHGELDFRCLAPNDPELRRPILQPVPNIRIENTSE
jgi:hypothetical protein